MTDTVADDETEITTDPARWPFCEARARQRAAESAYPTPDQEFAAGRRRIFLQRT